MGTSTVLKRWTKEEWFSEYKEIAQKYFLKFPDKTFNLGEWDSHEQDYRDGYTPMQGFTQDLYTDE